VASLEWHKRNSKGM